jgi:hypothetical protein
MPPKNDRASVVYQCRFGHRHEMCVTVTGRPVHPDLSCPPEQPPGYGPGGGGGCSVPPDLSGRVERELRDALQEHRRRGYVLIADG